MISPKTRAGAREAGWVGKDQQRCDFQKSLAGSEEEDWSVNYTAEVILLSPGHGQKQAHGGEGGCVWGEPVRQF